MRAVKKTYTANHGSSFFSLTIVYMNGLFFFFPLITSQMPERGKMYTRSVMKQ